VMSAMGLFDVKGLTEINPKFEIGSPLFDKITIQLNPKYYSGKEFVIETKNNSKENKYIQSVSLNNKNQKSVFLPFAEVVKGGKLVLEMDAVPNKLLNK